MLGKKEKKDFWVKAFLDNKITAKNTWSSDLIEQFKELNTFCTSEGVNFQKATVVLDGCIKVYSLRVDDVSENTQRLLKILGDSEEEICKKSGKKGELGCFIAKNPTLINMPLDTVESFQDSRFRSILHKTDESYLVDSIKVTKKGFLLYKDFHEEEKPKLFISTLSEGIKRIKIDYYNYPICEKLETLAELPTMEFKESGKDNFIREEVTQLEDKDDLADQISMQIIEKEESSMVDKETLDFSVFKPEDSLMNRTDFYNISVVNQSVEESTEVQGPIEEINSQFVCSPFEYFSGKEKDEISNSDDSVEGENVKGSKNVQRKRKSEFINFNEDLQTNDLHEFKDMRMNKEQYKKYKKNDNFLLEENIFDKSDLFKLNIYKEIFYINDDIIVGNDDIEGNNNIDIINDDIINDDIIENNTIEGNNTIENNTIEGNNIIENNNNIENNFKPSSSISKKVNILKLKNDILSEIKNKSTGYKEIFSKLNGKYIEKEKEISPHFYVIGLLHLANENNFELITQGKDIKIRNF